MRPAGNGRVRVRCIFASCSRSTYWLSAFVPAATSAVPISACRSSSGSTFCAAKRKPAAVVITTISTMRDFERTR
jgi:hypothetical protein